MTAPKLRFKDFDGHWTKSKLGDLCVRNYQGINTVADKVEYQKIGYPILQAKHITSEKLDFDDVRFLSDLDFEKYRKKYIPKTNDILFSNIGTIGKVVLVGESEPFFIAWNIFLISVKTDLVAPFYLATYLRRLTSLSYFDNLQTGNATKFINKTDLLDTGVTLPSKLEQTKIASFLSAVDEKISQLTQKHELLSQYKQGMMQKLFSQQTRFKADDGSEFGEWEDKKLGDICSHFQSGKTITSATISDNGAYPVFGGNGLRGFTDTYTHDGIFALIGRQGALCGNINLVQGENFISEHAIAVQANQESSTQWLAMWLDFMQLNRFSESSAQAGLAVNKLVKFDIKVPCLEEQTKIANFLSSIDQKIEVVAQQIQHAKLWKKGLLQQMFV